MSKLEQHEIKKPSSFSVWRTQIYLALEPELLHCAILRTKKKLAHV